MGQPKFDFYEAFSRNIGFLQPEELHKLRGKKVAIAGMGGVGGAHLTTLVRLGVGNFHIADFDQFELGNFNRQAGASVSTLSKPKVDVMAKMALDINPELGLKKFAKGVTPENLAEFLEGVDLYVDGLDISAFEIRRLVFMECHKRNIPVITVAPVGMGFSMVNFLPGGMTFDEYWRTDATMSPTAKVLTFLKGLLPTMIHRRSVVYPQAFDFEKQKTSSTPMGVMFATAVVGTEALKMLLQRGAVVSAPNIVIYDGYTYRIKKVRLWWGTANPILKIKSVIMSLVGFLK